MPLGCRREPPGDKTCGYSTDEKQHRLPVRNRFGIGDEIAPTLLADPPRKRGDVIGDTIGIGRERHLLAMQALRRAMQRLCNAMHRVGGTAPLLGKQRSGGIPKIFDDLLGNPRRQLMRCRAVLAGSPLGEILREQTLVGFIRMHIRSTSRVRAGSKGSAQGCHVNFPTIESPPADDCQPKNNRRLQPLAS
jgi:hypothetical protein